MPHRLSVDFYRTLFDTMDEGFCVIEFVDGPHGPLSDYVHVEANAAYTRNAGIPDVVGKRLREIVPDEADAWIARYGQVLRTGESIRFDQELLATGRVLSLSAFRIGEYEDRRVAVLFNDVTERRRAERALAMANDALETRFAEVLAERKILADVVEGSGVMVQVIDRDFRWIAINRAAADEYERGVGLRPSVGDRLDDVLGVLPEQLDRARQAWTRALSGEDLVDVVTLGDERRGQRQFEMHFSALRDVDGLPYAAFQLAYDVTERFRAEARLTEAEGALRQAQKMEAVGQLTGGLAHDFNNLLAGIGGAFEMIRIRLAQGRSADVERYLVAGQGAMRRAAALTHRLLAFSRRQTLSPKAINVNRLTSELVELVRRTVGPGIEVETISDSSLWATMVDANQLENAILNLCINARDAMRDGGRIGIETANRWLDRQAAHERGMEPGQYVAVCVSDTGTGIDKETLARVFDPFFTTKPLGEGTGLGLSMVYGFARQSHGHVRIHSEVGVGTDVCIYLPRYLGETEPEELAIVDHAPIAADGQTVLVVDDEPTVRMLVTDALGDLGFRCVEAEDGPSALTMLDTLPRVDLLITDVGLPGGLNGRQVAEAVRSGRPGVKVLFVTGYAENAALNHGHIEQGMEVMTKPFAIDDLAARVERLVRL